MLTEANETAVVAAVRDEAKPPTKEAHRHHVRADNPFAGRKAPSGLIIANTAQIDAVLKKGGAGLSLDNTMHVLHRQGLASSQERIRQRRKVLWPREKWHRGRAALKLNEAALMKALEGVRAKPIRTVRDAKVKYAPSKRPAETEDPFVPVAEALKATMAGLGISSLAAKVSPDGKMEFIFESLRRIEV